MTLKAEVIWNEAHASAALNRAQYGLRSPGVHRGFGIKAGSLLNFDLTLHNGRSIAVVETTTDMNIVVHTDEVETIPVTTKVAKQYLVINVAYLVGVNTVIEAIFVDTLLAEHICLASVTVPPATTQVTDAMIDFDDRMWCQEMEKEFLDRKQLSKEYGSQYFIDDTAKVVGTQPNWDVTLGYCFIRGFFCYIDAISNISYNSDDVFYIEVTHRAESTNQTAFVSVLSGSTLPSVYTDEFGLKHWFELIGTHVSGSNSVTDERNSGPASISETLQAFATSSDAQDLLLNDTIRNTKLDVLGGGFVDDLFARCNLNTGTNYDFAPGTAVVKGVRFTIELETTVDVGSLPAFVSMRFLEGAKGYGDDVVFDGFDVSASGPENASTYDVNGINTHWVPVAEIGADGNITDLLKQYRFGKILGDHYLDQDGLKIIKNGADWQLTPGRGTFFGQPVYRLVSGTIPTIATGPLPRTAYVEIQMPLHTNYSYIGTMGSEATIGEVPTNYYDNGAETYHYYMPIATVNADESVTDLLSSYRKDLSVWGILRDEQTKKNNDDEYLRKILASEYGDAVVIGEGIKLTYISGDDYTITPGEGLFKGINFELVNTIELDSTTLSTFPNNVWLKIWRDREGVTRHEVVYGDGVWQPIDYVEDGLSYFFTLVGEANAQGEVDDSLEHNRSTYNVKTTTVRNEYPEVLISAGNDYELQAVVDGGADDIVISAGQVFLYKGISEISTDHLTLMERTISLSGLDTGKNYHLRWDASQGFYIVDEDDVTYNPSALGWEEPWSDTTFTDMFIGRLTYNGPGVIWEIQHLLNKRSLTLFSAHQEVVSNSVVADTAIPNFPTPDYFWSRSAYVHLALLGFTTGTFASSNNDMAEAWIYPKSGYRSKQNTTVYYTHDDQGADGGEIAFNMTLRGEY